jgi:hypothetical protein
MPVGIFKIKYMVRCLHSVESGRLPRKEDTKALVINEHKYGTSDNVGAVLASRVHNTWAIAIASQVIAGLI